MSLRPRATAFALSGVAAVTLVTASACSTGSDAPSTHDTGTASGQAASTPVVDALPTTPLDKVILGTGEAPGNGFVQPVDQKATTEQLSKWTQAQGKPMYTTPECDQAGRLDTPLNHVATDAKAASVLYKDAEDEKKVYVFGIVLAPTKMDGFLDRALYQACTASTRADLPNVKTTTKVEDAPAVPGATGFKVTVDHEGTEADGRTSHLRLISYHGYAHGVTTAIDYSGLSSDPNVPVVNPLAENVLQQLYTTQMTKLAGAQ